MTIDFMREPIRFFGSALWGSANAMARKNTGINDAANGIPIGHPNPHGYMHTTDYHQTVRDRLYDVESRMKQQGYEDRAIRSALRRELRAIDDETLNATALNDPTRP